MGDSTARKRSAIRYFEVAMHVRFTALERDGVALTEEVRAMVFQETHLYLANHPHLHQQFHAEIAVGIHQAAKEANHL